MEIEIYSVKLRVCENTDFSNFLRTKIASNFFLSGTPLRVGIN